ECANFLHRPTVNQFDCRDCSCNELCRSFSQSVRAWLVCSRDEFCHAAGSGWDATDPEAFRVRAPRNWADIRERVALWHWCVDETAGAPIYPIWSTLSALERYPPSICPERNRSAQFDLWDRGNCSLWNHMSRSLARRGARQVLVLDNQVRFGIWRYPYGCDIQRQMAFSPRHARLRLWDCGSVRHWLGVVGIGWTGPCVRDGGQKEPLRRNFFARSIRVLGFSGMPGTLFSASLFHYDSAGGLTPGRPCN